MPSAAFPGLASCNDRQVDATEHPDYLRATASAVAEFRDALNAFLELHVVNDWMAPAVLLRNDADPERLRELRAKVSRAAGRAVAAPALTYIEVRGAGRVDPIAAWETITMPKPLLKANNVLDASEQMLGRLEGLILRAEAEAPPRSARWRCTPSCGVPPVASGGTSTTGRRSLQPPTPW